MNTKPILLLGLLMVLIVATGIIGGRYMTAIGEAGYIGLWDSATSITNKSIIGWYGADYTSDITIKHWIFPNKTIKAGSEEGYVVFDSKYYTTELDGVISRKREPFFYVSAQPVGYENAISYLREIITGSDKELTLKGKYFTVRSTVRGYYPYVYRVPIYLKTDLKHKNFRIMWSTPSVEWVGGASGDYVRHKKHEFNKDLGIGMVLTCLKDNKLYEMSIINCTYLRGYDSTYSHITRGMFGGLIGRGIDNGVIIFEPSVLNPDNLTIECFGAKGVEITNVDTSECDGIYLKIYYAYPITIKNPEYKPLFSCQTGPNDLLAMESFAGNTTIDLYSTRFPVKSFCLDIPAIITDAKNNGTTTTAELYYRLIAGGSYHIPPEQTVTLFYIFDNSEHLVPTMCDVAKEYYDVNSEKCTPRIGVVQVCSAGVFDPDKGVCVVEPVIEEAKPVCKVGRYDTSLKACVYNPPVKQLCVSGTLNETTGECILPIEGTCPPGYVKEEYEEGKYKCVLPVENVTTSTVMPKIEVKEVRVVPKYYKWLLIGLVAIIFGLLIYIIVSSVRKK